MLQKILLPVVIFVIILVALTFGEAISHDMFAWISSLTGLVINNFADIYNAAAAYVQHHTGKVVIALVLTVPITWWALKSQGNRLSTPNNRRKVAIILAVFLGWLGGHRFYLGEIGMGVLYLVILYVFAPLAVILGLIDAIRYIFMSDDDFTTASSQLTQ